MADHITLPLADAQMLMDWMERTFGNPEGVDWHDEDAAAVGDALYQALDNFRRTQEALAAASPALPEQPGRCETEQDCTQEPWCRLKGACQNAAPPISPAPSHDAEKALILARALIVWKNATPEEWTQEPHLLRAMLDNTARFLGALAASPAPTEEPRLTDAQWMAEAERLAERVADSDANAAKYQLGEPGRQESRRTRIAALLAHLGKRPTAAASEGPGWKLVPIEPPLSMVDAAVAHVIESDPDDLKSERFRARGCVVAVYKDMIAAAPSPSQPTVDSGDEQK